jgi:hypothetical protein
VADENSSAAEPAQQKMADTCDREIISSRVFDAPRDLVFKMWTDPKHLAPWWGPNGFTTTVQQMDVQPGGLWRMVMHGRMAATTTTDWSFSRLWNPNVWSIKRIAKKTAGDRHLHGAWRQDRSHSVPGLPVRR